MAYADLKREIWDARLSGEKRPNPTQNSNTEFTPEDYFFYMVHKGDSEGQLKFFEEMTMAEYEEAGDFFIEQFIELMKKIGDTRKKSLSYEAIPGLRGIWRPVYTCGYFEKEGALKELMGKMDTVQVGLVGIWRCRRELVSRLWGC